MDWFTMFMLSLDHVSAADMYYSLLPGSADLSHSCGTYQAIRFCIGKSDPHGQQQLLQQRVVTLARLNRLFSPNSHLLGCMPCVVLAYSQSTISTCTG